MIERLQDEFGATVNRDTGEIGFYTNYGQDYQIRVVPSDAVEGVADIAETWDEDKNVLLWTVPQINPRSLRSSLSDIKDAAEEYLNTIEYALLQMNSWRAAGMSDEEIRGKLDSPEFGKLKFDMDNGMIYFDNPDMYRDCGTCGKMTVDDVMKALLDEYNSHDIDDLICHKIRVYGTDHGALPISDLIDESHEIHKTLLDMASMLQEQRDLEQQEECR